MSEICRDVVFSENKAPAGTLHNIAQGGGGLGIGGGHRGAYIYIYVYIYPINKTHE